MTQEKETRVKKTRFNNKILLAAATFAFVFAVAFFGLKLNEIPLAAASFSERIPFSATLLDAKGSSVPDGDYKIFFRFYSASIGGSPLWEEEQSIKTGSGKFETLLGSIIPFSILNFDQNLFVSVQVENDEEMTPRKQVGATPQAIISKRSTSLVAPSSGEIIASGGNLHIMEGLEVDGNATINGTLVFSNGAQLQSSGALLAINRSLLPSETGLDLGSPTQRWSRLYADSIEVGGLGMDGTTSSTFTINMDSEADEDSTLLFDRGDIHGGLKWNGTDNLFELYSDIESLIFSNLKLAGLSLTSSLAIKEGLAPAISEGYGKIYTASDNSLHYLDESGTDTNISSPVTPIIQELVKKFTAEAGENIVAGNLVSYINGKVKKGEVQKIGSPGVFEAASTANISAVALSANKLAVSYSDLGNSNFGTTVIGTVSGSTISWGEPSVFESGSTYNADPGVPINISMVALSSSKIAVSFTDVANSSYGTTIIGDINNTTISWGNASVFSDASTSFISAVPLSSNKIAVSYSNINNAGFGTAIVGTIIGTDISWGDASVFESAITNHISAALLSSDKFSVSYTDEGNLSYGTTIIGSISEQSISWGTAVVFESASTENISSTALSSDKIVLSYSDMGNAEYGTAVIGTISGNTITFGSASVFEPYSTYDSANTFVANSTVVALSSDKIIISYQDHGNSKYGTSIIGEISGTAITWNTAVTFENSRTEFISAVVLSPNKVAVGYQDVGNSRYGTYEISNLEPYLGVSKNACAAGQICNVAIKGVVSGLSSLSTGMTYYTGANGTLTTIPYPNRVGVAVSTTEIALDGKWDSGDLMVSDLIFKNSFRMTEFQNSSGQQGLTMYDQSTKQILQLTDSGKLALLSASIGSSYTNISPIQDGLIVEGSVGVGTSSPLAKFHVVGNTGTTSTIIDSNETSAANNVLLISSDISGDNNSIFRVQADGAVYATGAYTNTGADYAEYFQNEENISVGSLVGLNPDTGKVRHYCSGDKLIGVISNNAGFIGNKTEEIENDPNYSLVGLMGQLTITPDDIHITDGTAYSTDGVQVGHSLLGGKILIDIVVPNNKLNEVLLSFDESGALTLGAGTKLYWKSDGLLVVENSLDILKDLFVQGKLITPAGETQYLAPESVIIASKSKVKVSGKENSVTLSGSMIDPGEDGQNLILQGTDDERTVTLDATAEGSLVKLGADTRVLGKGDTLNLSYDKNDNYWYEISFSNN